MDSPKRFHLPIVATGVEGRETRGYGNLPIELFKTDRGHWVFDARNVCFSEVDPVAYDLLALLREKQICPEESEGLLPQHEPAEIQAAWEDLRALQAEGLFTPYRFERRPRHGDDEYEPVLSRRMGGFTIFVTTKCNLGCSYCIYGGQYDQHEELSQTAMPWETMQATMDFLAAHSVESKEIRLDFFGGEPLTAFSMIERGVRYLKSIVHDKKVIVTISSNGTILSDRILDFLLEHEVYLQFSIDGAKASHDRNRPFKGSARGSYERILCNLQKIHDRDLEYYQRCMRLKGVLTTTSLEEDDLDFFTHPLIKLLIENKHFSFLNEEPHYDLARDADYFDRIHLLGRKLLELRNLRSENDLLSALNVKQRALYHHTLAHFFEGQAINRVYFDGSDATPFTKGCLTGYQEGAVSPNGEISICLKSAKGNNFVIGNVRKDWYLDKIRKLNHTFHHDWSGCSSCFVQKMCDLCYEKLDGEETRWIAGRMRFCEFNRQRYRTIFDIMLRVVENNPELWDDLEQTIRSRLQGRPNDPYGSQSLYSQQE